MTRIKIETKDKLKVAVVITTTVSVLLSVLVTYLVTGNSGFSSGIVPATIVPLIVAPVASYFCFSQMLTIHLLNKELIEIVNHDTLTQVYSRSYFFDEAKNDESKESAVTLMIDADNFKQINDRYGHEVGDAALKHLSTIITGATRKNDVVGRLGGEEFGVYMPATDYRAATIVAERILKAIQDKPMYFEDTEIQMTVSIGLAKRHQYEHINSVLRRADKALYQAKNTGKNRLCFDEVPSPELAHQFAT